MKLLPLSLLCGLISISLYAAPAFPGEKNFSQKDGSHFKGKLKGDEWLHWIALENDFVAVFNRESKAYEYAVIKTEGGQSELVSSGIKVNEALHLLHPDKLAKSVSPLVSAELQKVYKSKRNYHLGLKKLKDQNSTYKNRNLDTKSTQWKEVLKGKNPPVKAE